MWKVRGKCKMSLICIEQMRHAALRWARQQPAALGVGQALGRRAGRAGLKAGTCLVSGAGAGVVGGHWRAGSEAGGGVGGLPGPLRAYYRPFAALPRFEGCKVGGHYMPSPRQLPCCCC